MGYIKKILGDKMKEQHKRTVSLIGETAQKKLCDSHVCIFGIGGVGGYVAEALSRAGVGRLTLVDHDVVSVSNINRQIYALHSTLGMKKVEAARRRIADIDPDIEVICRDEFFLPENSADFDFTVFDYVCDCVDTVSAKIELVIRSKEAGVPIISSMGTANKLDAAAFEISDIKKTEMCPLARVMRKELKQRGIKDLKVVYSKEEPRRPRIEEYSESKKLVPASISYAPATAGLILASEVISDIIGKDI